MFQNTLKNVSIAATIVLSLVVSSAYAQTVSGGWLVDNGDMIYILKSPQNRVVAMNLSANKQLKKLFFGTLAGSSLNLISPDKTESLDVTLDGTNFSGLLTVNGAIENITAKYYLGYVGSTYDGLWESPGTDDDKYLSYFTLDVQGVPMSYVVFADIDSANKELVAYNLFVGAPAKQNSTGSTVYAGVSFINTALLKLKFGSPTSADAKITDNSSITTFSVQKLTFPQSGQ